MNTAPYTNPVKYVLAVTFPDGSSYERLIVADSESAARKQLWRELLDSGKADIVESIETVEEMPT